MMFTLKEMSALGVQDIFSYEDKVVSIGYRWSID